jgi:hypothetical protein
MTRSFCSVWGIALIALGMVTACGEQTPGTPASGGTGASGGSGGAVGGAGGSAGSGGIAGASADCSAFVDAIAIQTAGQESCTAVVRVSFASHAIVSHAFVCGAAKVIDEAAARSNATADTGYGEGTLLTGSTPPDEWVFFELPSDLGGVGVVSARSGLSVFGGSIIWAGSGSMTYPKSWDSTSLGSNCSAVAKPNVRGFDLAQAGSALAQTQTDQATDVVWDTALAQGLSKNGSVLDALVLFYAPEVGYTGPDGAGFNPKTAEYIVLVNANASK